MSSLTKLSWAFWSALLIALIGMGFFLATGPITQQALAVPECENDYCDAGWLWDSCEVSDLPLGCDMISSRRCETYAC